MSDGYVYIMTNRAMPGLVKIGMTTRPPQHRQNELWQTGVPVPFDLHFFIRTPSSRQLEQMCHQALAGERVDDAREFFAVTPERAQDVLTMCEDEVLCEWLERYRPGYTMIERECFIDPSVVNIIARDLNVIPEVVSLAMSSVDAPRVADLVAEANLKWCGGES